MPRIDVVPARPEHIDPVARHMRAADRAEIWASGLLLPHEALRLSLAASALAWTGLVDRRPACLFGVCPAGPGHGVPWLLGTDGVEANAAAFLRRNRAYVGRMQERFAFLSNHVDARNAASMRWLRWLGFTLADAVPHGPFALPFHPFHLVRT